MKKINNSFTAISPTAPRFEKTEDGFLRCTARILAERIMPYGIQEFEEVPDGTPDPMRMYAPYDSISSKESLRSLEGCPVVTGDHNWLSPEVIKEFGVGSTAGTPRMDGPYVVCDLLITDPDAIAAIEDGTFGEISAAYLADSIFNPGEFDGNPYDAKQTGIKYNHIAVIPFGNGRAGQDVRIINHKAGGTEKMPETKKLVRIQLANTKRYVNVEEDTATAIEEETQATEKVGEESSASLEETMSQLETKNAESESLQSELEELKGELSVYKEKLDQLLSGDQIEEAAEGMIEEKEDSEEIIANMAPVENESEEDLEKRKGEVMNSLKGVYGNTLHTTVLTAVGVKCENMSPESLRGAFKAQSQIVKHSGPRKKVAGARMLNADGKVVVENAAPTVRTARQRLGFDKA
jgi:hypothetical protein